MEAYMLSEANVQKINLPDTIIENENNYFIVTRTEHLITISSKFNLSECVTDNCIEKRQHTGIETFKDHYCINLNVPGITEGRVTVQEINLYFGKNFLICVTNEEINIISKIEEEIQNNFSVVFKGVPNPINKLLYLLFDRLVLKSLGVITELERKIEAQEERVLKVGRRNMVNELIFLRRQVLKIKRFLNPLIYIDDMLLLNELEIIDEQMIKYFNNVSIKFSELNNDANELYHSISNLREAYESEISNQLNEIMKIFTIISTIFLPLTLVSGIYGMNFEYMPELKFKYGYYLILGIMACITLGLIMIFKKKKWI